MTRSDPALPAARPARQIVAYFALAYGITWSAILAYLLERYSPLRAGLILGLLWALWHALADLSGNVATMGVADWAVRMIVFWIVPLTCYRVLMTWAYAHHRSLALGMLMHAGYTGWLASFTMEMPAATGPGALLWQAIFAGGIVVLTAVVVTLSAGRHASLGSAPA